MSLLFRGFRKQTEIKKEEVITTTSVPTKGLVYGVDLEESAPKQIDDILTYLERHCISFFDHSSLVLKLQGIFRISGRATEMKVLKERIEAGVQFDEIVSDYEGDISALEAVGHNFTGLIKTWLREMPDPLLTYKMFDEFVNAAKITEAQERLNAVRGLVEKLPEPNKMVLARLMYTLRRVVESEKINKMGPDNLSIVFGSNILRPPLDVSALEVAQKTGFINKCCRIILENSSTWFAPQNNGKKKMSSRKPPRVPKKWSVRSAPAIPGGNVPLKTKDDEELDKWLKEDHQIVKQEPKGDELDDILGGF